MDDRVPAQIEVRVPAAIEHVDLRRVADAVQRSLQGDRVVDAQARALRFADRSRAIMRHRHAARDGRSSGLRCQKP